MAFDADILRSSLDDPGREALYRDQRLEQARKLHRQQQALDEAERAPKRPAAPFRIAPDKPPGRQGGHEGHSRARPERIDAHIEVPLEGCPHCAGPLGEVHPVRQLIEEVPPVRVYVTELAYLPRALSRLLHACLATGDTHDKGAAALGGGMFQGIIIRR